MISAQKIVATQDTLTELWHRIPFSETPEENDKLLALVGAQHQTNFELWHAEDGARDPNASDSDIARLKRVIDQTNQKRNDLVEQCDMFLLEEMKESIRFAPDAELHSETPGLIIDRLSILSLKLFHTMEEIERTDAPEGHAERNRKRYDILAEQRKDLADCLDCLWQQITGGTRRFKLYRQMKMYNDPTLNPKVYRGSAGG